MLQNVLTLIKQAVHFIACFMIGDWLCNFIDGYICIFRPKMIQTTVYEEDILLFF